jgi:hypothetical protein
MSKHSCGEKIHPSRVTRGTRSLKIDQVLAGVDHVHSRV